MIYDIEKINHSYDKPLGKELISLNYHLNHNNILFSNFVCGSIVAFAKGFRNVLYHRKVDEQKKVSDGSKSS